MKNCTECQNYKDNNCYPLNENYSFRIVNPYSEDFCPIFKDKEEKLENKENLEYNINKDEERREE